MSQINIINKRNKRIVNTEVKIVHMSSNVRTFFELNIYAMQSVAIIIFYRRSY